MDDDQNDTLYPSYFFSQQFNWLILSKYYPNVDNSFMVCFQNNEAEDPMEAYVISIVKDG